MHYFFNFTFGLLGGPPESWLRPGAKNISMNDCSRILPFNLWRKKGRINEWKKVYWTFVLDISVFRCRDGGFFEHLAHVVVVVVAVADNDVAVAAVVVVVVD